jgi:hypothetical protein
VTGIIIRESLETTDEALAELLRQRLDLETALLAPRFQAVEIPQRVRDALGIQGAVCDRSEPQVAAPEFSLHPPSLHMMAAKKRTTLDEAVATYLRFIAFENAPLHVANKVSILRRFMGADRVEKAGGR